ncbi:4-phosphopantetheinyl transferase [Halomonas salipaludis]|uniref:4-phosphopantetheinyl transferase n=1 Tax=Halomonas salipaludis TaxID=2032625 RepID=A0A2A2F076_9GAMM|nr:4-phosphopantetheinyl transferase [Halomonas salipaludis]
MTAYLDLLLIQAPAGSNGACLSRLGRESLSRLAARRKFNCSIDGWSPRGSGPPRHPGLPAPWQTCLSHSQDMVIAGLANIPVGVDLEGTQARHLTRLPGLVDQLPHPQVRWAIHGSANPLLAFYRTWTLYEALYKHASLAGHSPKNLFATRLYSTDAISRHHAWTWQTPLWTVTIVAQQRTMVIRSLPHLELSQSLAADRLAMP